MPRKKTPLIIATLDFETDPFMYGRIPKPFAVELYTDSFTFTAWGSDCVEKLMTFLDRLDTPLLIYAHNGGKFDFHFLHKYIDNPIRIISSRIVSAKLGIHWLRDSFAIMPFPLRAYAKEDIDYKKLESHVREKHKPEILHYLHIDCFRLYELVTAFVERFGAILTIGSTAMQEIRKRHEFDRMSEEGDAYFRRYYYGGRVQCFNSGIINGPFIGLDLNSAYPKCMRDKRHPVNGQFDISTTIPDNFDFPYFVHFEGTNKNALPCKSDETDELEFTETRGEFFACSHEIEVALKYGLIDIHKVISCAIAQEWITFDTFVDDFYKEKAAAKISGDKITELFTKYVLNSGYGKFGQNPDNYLDWYINRDFGCDDDLVEQGYMIESEYDDFELWSKPAVIKETSFFDVSIAASITSGTRAMLLEGIQQAEQPIYCDTDSLICKGFNGVIDPTELGAWKHEFTADHVAVAGKKLYMAWDKSASFKSLGNNKFAGVHKLASKGGLITPRQLLDVAGGKSAEYRNQAPTFSLRSRPRFITRRFTKTVDDVEILEDNLLAE